MSFLTARPWKQFSASGVIVEIRAEAVWWGVIVDYRATLADLLLVGALTSQMAESLTAKKTGAARYDANGFSYQRYSVPVKACPDRIVLSRNLGLGGAGDAQLAARVALSLPGIAAVFPNDIRIPTSEEHRSRLEHRCRLIKQKYNAAVERPSFLRLVWSNPALT